MKKKPIFITASLVFLGVLLSGCAYFPIQTAAPYIKDLYRRIPYKIDGRYRVIEIFYATSRVVEGGADLSSSFLPELAEETSYGRMNIKVDPRLKIGRMRPAGLKKRGMIEMQDVSELGSGDFMQQLGAAVKNSPHNSLLVVAFGYKDDFEITAIKAAYFAYLLDVNTPVLLFDWPGDQPVSIGGYKKAKSLAAASGPYLGELLARIVREIRPQRIWIQSSSLACQVVCSAFEHLYKYKDFADSDFEIDHVILSAPDVDADEFDETFKDEIAALTRHLTSYVSSDDEVLLLSGIIDGEKKLGRHVIKPTEHVRDHREFEEMKDLLYLKSLHPDKIALVDVTPINRASYRHGYYLESPEFFDDFYSRIISEQPTVNRRLYLMRVKDKVDCWVLLGGR
ncbi:MAG: alpha/beta hydrolase [Candidatus Omnitrophota bacterium]